VKKVVKVNPVPYLLLAARSENEQKKNNINFQQFHVSNNSILVKRVI
jgi:hypothetical protein